MRVANLYHFAYEDGTPYYSIGTTCYVWDLQSDERIAETSHNGTSKDEFTARYSVYYHFTVRPSAVCGWTDGGANEST